MQPPRLGGIPLPASWGKGGGSLHLLVHEKAALIRTSLPYVDPILRTLEAYRLEGERWVVASTHGSDERVRAEPFEAIEVDLGRWWMPS